MVPVDFLRIARFINDCPNCKSDRVGDEEGTLSVDHNIVKRTCKCGFVLEYDVNNGTSRAKIKKVVEEAISNMKLGEGLNK